MGKKIIITAETNADSLEDEVSWDCEEAVSDTLKEWGYLAETTSKVE